MRGKKKIYFLTVVIFALGLLGFSYDKSKEINEKLGVDLDNKLLEYFKSQYPENEVIKCGYEDLNNNGRKDLVVIFRKTKSRNAMIVVVDNGSKYEITGEVPAPLENQRIEFKNIDDIEPIEFIVSGSKNGRFGYAIFRLEGLKINNLFGEGMEDCC